MEKKKTPALTQSLGERIAICAERMGGVRAIADGCHVNESQVYRYIKGERVPRSEFLTRLATIANISSGWLLAGEGMPDVTPDHKRPPFRPELLTNLSKLLDECVQEQNFRLTPLQKAKALTFLYGAACHEEAQSAGRPAFLSTAEILGAIDYLTALSPIEDGIDLHLQAMRILEQWDEPDKNLYLPFFLERWNKLVVEGQQQYMDRSQGENMYNMLGYNISPNTAKRLNDFITRILASSPTKEMTILDIGCGNGRELAYIYQHYPFLRTKGIDISEQAVKMGRSIENSGKLPKGSIVQASMMEMPFPANSIDHVYCRFTLAFIPIISNDEIELGALKAIQEAARVLKPGGTLEIIAPFGTGRDYLPLRQRYNQNDFKEFAKKIPQLQILTCEEQPPMTRGVAYRFEEKFTHRCHVIFKRI